MTFRSESGLTLLELLVSLALFSIAVTAFAKLVVGGAQLNKTQQMTISAQSNARNSVSIIEQSLRTAGWNPRNVAFARVVHQSPAEAADNWIEVFADLDGDTTTSGVGEDVTFRLNGTTLEWKRSASGSFETLTPNITNDADGDGTPELMFTTNSPTIPTIISVKVTARSAAPDPRTGQYIRATVATDVVLRGSP